jgi:hypothetical protein
MGCLIPGLSIYQPNDMSVEKTSMRLFLFKLHKPTKNFQWVNNEVCFFTPCLLLGWLCLMGMEGILLYATMQEHSLLEVMQSLANDVKVHLRSEYTANTLGKSKKDSKEKI